MDATEFKVSSALKETGDSPDLTDREKHLIGLAVTLTRGCHQCTSRRMDEALKSGISYDTLKATVDLSAAVNAGVVLRTAISSTELAEIEKSCQGDECAAGT